MKARSLRVNVAVMAHATREIEKVRYTQCTNLYYATALRESYSHLQKTSQQLEKELGRRKEKEAELLAFSEKLSSSNAELQAEKTSLESQV